MYMYCHKGSPCPYLPTPLHHFNQINWINLIKTQMQLLWFLWWLVFIHNYLISEMIKNNRLGIFFICWRAILHCTDSYWTWKERNNGVNYHDYMVTVWELILRTWHGLKFHLCNLSVYLLKFHTDYVLHCNYNLELFGKIWDSWEIKEFCIHTELIWETSLPYLSF